MLSAEKKTWKSDDNWLRYTKSVTNRQVNFFKDRYFSGPWGHTNDNKAIFFGIIGKENNT